MLWFLVIWVKPPHTHTHKPTKAQDVQHSWGRALCQAPSTTEEPPAKMNSQCTLPRGPSGAPSARGTRHLQGQDAGQLMPGGAGTLLLSALHKENTAHPVGGKKSRRGKEVAG